MKSSLLSQTDWTTKQFAKVYGLPDSYLGGQGDQQSSLDMISGQYGKVVSRYLRPVVSELVNKLSTDIDTDLFPAIDPLGTGYIWQRVALLRKIKGFTCYNKLKFYRKSYQNQVILIMLFEH